VAKSAELLLSTSIVEIIETIIFWGWGVKIGDLLGFNFFGWHLYQCTSDKEQDFNQLRGSSTV